MTDTVVAHLERDLVVVAGPDATSFLQSLVSQDLDPVEVGGAVHALLLEPRGFTKVRKWLTLQYRYRTGIGRDDLIDACACAVAARDSTNRVGGDEIDPRGLRMEINY